MDCKSVDGLLVFPDDFGRRAAAVGLEVGYRLFTANDWESAGTAT